MLRRYAGALDKLHHASMLKVPQPKLPDAPPRKSNICVTLAVDGTYRPLITEAVRA